VRITFLGTSAGTPTRQRNVTSQAVQFDDGELWLLDCGEATQHQLMRAGIRAGRCARILLTHLHGDHCYGLPGMLSCIGIHGRSEPVEIVGPVGVRELVETVIRLSDAQLPFPLVFHELPAAGGVLPHRAGWAVSAHPLVHRVPCLGYVLGEDPRPGRFHPERAVALGLPDGPLYRQLQLGETVRLADGREISPEAVCDPPRPGRKVVLLGDTSDASAIIPAGLGCDLLVCEATYDGSRQAKAVTWGHSTTLMTGELAARIRAKTLIITHFSSRYTDTAKSQTVADLVAETRTACSETNVIAADDIMTFAVDRA
jgi:ribonuclease Z